MKKFYSLLFLGIILINPGFSQMSFKENSIQKSAFNLREQNNPLIVKNSLDSKILIVDEENDMMKKKRRRGGRRSSSGDFSLLSYSRLGVTIPVGSFSDVANLGFLWQGMIEGVIQNKFGVGISFGYFVYPGKKFSDDYGNTYTAEPAWVMPLAATFKYYLMEEEFKPYVGVDLGIMFAGRPETESVTKFGGTPRAGFLFSFADYYVIGLDVSSNILENGSGLNFGLQFGYVFGD